FAVGLVLVTLRARRSSYFLLAAWFWLTLILGSVLSTDALFSPHIVGALGVIAMIPCVVFEAGWRGLVTGFRVWGKRAAATVAVVFLLLATQANYVDYFQIHARAANTSHFWGVNLEVVNVVGLSSEKQED